MDKDKTKLLLTDLEKEFLASNLKGGLAKKFKKEPINVDLKEINIIYAFLKNYPLHTDVDADVFVLRNKFEQLSMMIMV